MNEVFSNRPAALGSGLYRAGSGRPHGWSADWHLRPRKTLTGPVDSFALEPRRPPLREHVAVHRSSDGF